MIYPWRTWGISRLLILLLPSVGTDPYTIYFPFFEDYLNDIMPNGQISIPYFATSSFLLHVRFLSIQAGPTSPPNCSNFSCIIISSSCLRKIEATSAERRPRLTHPLLLIFQGANSNFFWLKTYKLADSQNQITSVSENMQL